jgi:hypothetical protein
MDRILDQKNPLGRPEASAMKFLIRLTKNKDYIDLKYKYHLGSVHLSFTLDPNFRRPYPSKWLTTPITPPNN